MQPSLTTTISPYSSYRFLQDQGRIHRLGQNWLVTGYQDAKEALSHPCLSARRVDQLAESLSANKRERINPLLDMLKSWSFFQDVSEAQECRQSLSKSLSPWVLSTTRNVIKELALEETHQLKNNTSKEVDLISEFSTPLRAKLLAHLLSEEEAITEELIPAANDIFRFIMTPKNTDETGERAFLGWRSLSQYFEQNRDIVFRNRFCQELFNSLDTERQFARFSVIVVGTIFLEKVFGNAMVCLFENPEEYLKLKQNPHLMRDAVREILRFESPTQITSRIALKEIEFCGEQISPGDRVSLLLGAANRDSKIWENPDQFIIDRPVKANLALGYGQKVCPGGWISSIFVEEVLKSIIMNDLTFKHLADDYCWFPCLESRRLTELNVEVI